MAAAASTTLSMTVAGAGARFSGEVQQLGRVETKLSKRPRKHFGWFSLNGHQLLHYKCFWQIPKNTNVTNFNSRHLPFLNAYGKGSKNVSEDTDDMYDDLFKKYGKVVFKRNDQQPSSSEVDDDAESLSFAVAMAKIASDVKAGDIKVLFVKPLVYWTQFFIIATAFSRPQIDAIGSRMRDLAEEKYGKVPSGDTKPNSWTLLDFGDVVVHIFLPQQRAFYNLEEFYGNATHIELPSENQPPFRS